MDAQTAILGHVINGNSIDGIIASNVTEAHFGDPRAKKTWEVLVKLHKQGVVIEPGIVMDLTNDGNYVGQLIAEAPITQNIEPYVAELLAKHWKQQSALKLSALAGELSQSQPFEEIQPLVEKMNTVFAETSEGPGGDLDRDILSMERAERTAGAIDQRVNDFLAGKTRGIPSGIDTIDRSLGGFYPGRLYLLGARTSVGKTTLAVNFAYNAAATGKKVVFYTIEMTGDEIAEKLVSRISMVDNARINVGDLKPDHVDAVMEGLNRLAKLPIIINDKSAKTIESLEASARKLKRKGHLDIMIVDYVQLMKSGKEFYNRQAEVAEISGRLKKLSQSLGIPIIALVQVNREADKAKDPTPQLSQLRDSGALEQDADVVLLLHRTRDEYAIANGGWSYVLNVSKNRNGSLGPCLLKAELPFNFFGERG